MIISSEDILNNQSLFKNWWTSYEASRWQFQSKPEKILIHKMCMSSVFFLATGYWRCYQTNWQRDTKTPVICKPQITGSQRSILEKYLYSWASAVGHHFFCFFVLWRNRILFGQVSVQYHMSVNLYIWTPTHSSNVPPLLSHHPVKGQEIASR